MTTQTFAAPPVTAAPAPARALQGRAARHPSLASRLAVLAYGMATYVVFLATFVYTIGWLWGVVVPRSMNDGEVVSMGETLAVNLGLLGLFGVQHLIMARPAFKARWTRIIPAAAERSTFVLATCAILILTFFQWRPLPHVIWATDGVVAGALWGLSALGFAIVLVSTFLIDHFELFGLSQVMAHVRGQPLVPPTFHERLFYKVVRHPLMTGFMLAFWSAPVMTGSRFLFALTCTVFVLVALRFEERDLIANHGEDYLDYKRRVPGLLPRPWSRAA